MRSLFAILTLVLVSACQPGDPTVEQTAVARNATLSTEIAAARQTATISAEQIRVTSDAVGTQIRGVTDRQQAIVSTLEGLGVMVVGVEFMTPIVAEPTPIGGGEANAAAGVAGSGGITLIPPTSQAREEPTLAPSPVVNVPPTVDPTAPNLSNVSISSTVGQDDCATGSGTSFDVSTPNLYAVGTANNFPAGMTLTFNWLRDGQIIFTDSFTWEAEVDGACVWYNATPAQFEFLPGTYSVTFESNGAPVSPPVAFVLTGGMDEAAGTTEVVP
jgi:hypothetical protein